MEKSWLYSELYILYIYRAYFRHLQGFVHSTCVLRRLSNVGRGVLGNARGARSTREGRGRNLLARKARAARVSLAFTPRPLNYTSACYAGYVVPDWFYIRSLPQSQFVTLTIFRFKTNCFLSISENRRTNNSNARRERDVTANGRDYVT